MVAINRSQHKDINHMEIPASSWLWGHQVLELILSFMAFEGHVPVPPLTGQAEGWLHGQDMGLVFRRAVYFRALHGLWPIA